MGMTVMKRRSWWTAWSKRQPMPLPEWASVATGTFGVLSRIDTVSEAWGMGERHCVVDFQS